MVPSLCYMIDRYIIYYLPYNESKQYIQIQNTDNINANDSMKRKKKKKKMNIVETLLTFLASCRHQK